MAIVMVVIRHLKGSRPVASAVIECPYAPGTPPGGVLEYLNQQADKHIADFKETYVEFKNAAFYRDIVTTETGE